MNKYLQGANKWMTKGKTTLIQKDTLQQLQTHNLTTNSVENINSKNKEEIYDSLTSYGLFPEEQKGNCKGFRETGELLYIDQHILNESKTRQKNLSMAWIDYKKAYDKVPQSWIINCFKMYKISHEVINFIKKTLKTWRVELTAGGRKRLPEVKIRRGIFQ